MAPDLPVNEDVSNICQSVKHLGGIYEACCDVAYSWGSVTAALHAVINDSHSESLAAQLGIENQNLNEVESGGLTEN